MSGPALTGNLAVLPRLAWLDGVAGSTLIRLSADSEQPVLQVRTARDQWVALHGRHDPVRDARRLLDAASLPTADAVVVLIGAAAGHVAEVLLDERHARHVLILEPHPLAARAMLARRDWRAALDAGRLTVLVGPDFAGAADAWRCFDGVDDARVRVIEDAVLAREHDPLVGRAREVLARIRFDAAANLKAREDLGATYALQTLTNVPEVLRAPSLQTLAGRAAGWPAVILAAGPSLWRNLENCRAWRERVVVIAVDTTVRTALAHGLEPDYIVAVDPTQANARHLRGLGTLTRSWLVAEASLAPATLDVCGDRRMFFRVADNVPWPWLVQHGLDLPRLAVWGSVLTAAYSLARHLSCASISLLGADLAFTDGQPYTRGVVFERDWARQRLAGVPVRQAWAHQRRKRPVVEVPDVSGGRVLSAPHLLAFRDWLVERSASDGMQVRNATGHGALLGPGIAQISVRDLEALPIASARFNPAPTADGGTSGTLSRRLQTAIAPGSQSRAGLEAGLTQIATSEDILATLASMSARLVTRQRLVPMVPPEARWLRGAYSWLDERMAQWVAARAGRTPPWIDAIGDEDDADQRTQAADALATWLSRNRLLTDKAPPSAPLLPATLPREVRLLMELPWQSDAEAAALALQAIAAREASARATLPGRWRSDPSAADRSTPDIGGPVEKRRQERAARLTVMALRTHLAIARTGDERDPNLDVFAALIDGCTLSPADEPLLMRAQLTLPDARLSAAGTIGSSALLSAIEGALLRAVATPAPLALRWADGPGLKGQVTIQPRLRASAMTSIVFSTPAEWLRPKWLTDHGLPPQCAASPSTNAQHAVITPRGARASLLIDADARTTPLREWPVALVAEIHGRHWHVALSQERGGQVCARAPHDEARIVTASITGVPYTAAWIDDDRVLVTTSTGLWEWAPPTVARHVADVPPAAIVDITGESVRLDPIPIVNDRYDPRVLREAWDVNLADGTVVSKALDAVGQAWSRTRRGRLVATAHAESNLIRLEADTVTCWLAWHRPRGVVWIDQHLVIWGADGRIALVRDAWSTVTSTLASGTQDVQPTASKGRDA